MNDDFRFATFFPEVVHPILDKLAGALGKYLCFFKLTSEATSTFGPGGPAQLPGSENADAARRRCDLLAELLRCACCVLPGGDVCSMLP